VTAVSRTRLALWAWATIAWIVLTWSRSVQLLVVGAVVAGLVAAALAPLGNVAAPWAALRPRRLAGLAVIVGSSAVRVVKANLVLAWRIWNPRRPIRSGMLVIPTGVETGGGLAALGIVSSLIVDNQLVDLEPGRLHYHAIWVSTTDPEEARRVVLGRLDRDIARFEQPPQQWPQGGPERG
jgi:multicomponent Na+:H+ antiporter subunit E